jgi:hypothetical protein
MKRFVARCTPWGTIQTGDYFCRLSPMEKQAVLAHERAHLIHHDALIRLWWILSLQVVFRPNWVFEQCRVQEFRADAYVKSQGLARGLRSFLTRFPHAGGPLHPSTFDRVGALDG